MKLIRDLEDLIEDEIHDIEKYAKFACELKDDQPQLAHVLYTISTQEDTHRQMIHDEVVKIIGEYRKNNGDPPAAMLAVYNHVHQKHIENLADAKRYQEMYRNN